MGTARTSLLFGAFADLTRVRILNLLRAGELSLAGLAECLGASTQILSQQLRYLEKAGLVVLHKEGRKFCYSLAPAEGRLHKNLLKCLAYCFHDVEELEADSERRTQAGAAGGCCQDAPRKQGRRRNGSIAPRPTEDKGTKEGPPA